MAKSFNKLRDKMSPKAKQKAMQKTQEMLADMASQDFIFLKQSDRKGNIKIEQFSEN